MGSSKLTFRETVMGGGKTLQFGSWNYSRRAIERRRRLLATALVPPVTKRRTTKYMTRPIHRVHSPTRLVPWKAIEIQPPRNRRLLSVNATRAAFRTALPQRQNHVRVNHTAQARAAFGSAPLNAATTV
jgi:hypothetical protein